MTLKAIRKVNQEQRHAALISAANYLLPSVDEAGSRLSDLGKNVLSEIGASIHVKGERADTLRMQKVSKEIYDQLMATTPLRRCASESVTRVF